MIDLQEFPTYIEIGMIDFQGFLKTRPTPAYDQHGLGWDRGALLSTIVPTDLYG